jgi:hypothetical protein
VLLSGFLSNLVCLHVKMSNFSRFSEDLHQSVSLKTSVIIADTSEDVCLQF